MNLIEKILSLPMNTSVEFTENDLNKLMSESNSFYKTGVQLYCSKCNDARTFVINENKTQSSMGEYIKELCSRSLTSFPISYSPIDCKEVIAKKHKDAFISKFNNFNGNFCIYLFCPICHEEIVYWFNYKENKIQKTAEFPSQLNGYKNIYRKYKKLKTNKFDYFIEFTTGIYVNEMCKSGVGSFTYMRRCLENCVYEYMDEELSHGNITQEQYDKALHFEDKIDLVKGRFDETLFSCIKSLYSLLSAGIHELDENECLNNFPLIRKVVEKILNSKYNNLIEKEENEKLKAELNNRSNQIKENNKKQ